MESLEPLFERAKTLAFDGIVDDFSSLWAGWRRMRLEYRVHTHAILPGLRRLILMASSETSAKPSKGFEAELEKSMNGVVDDLFKPEPFLSDLPRMA